MLLDSYQNHPEAKSLGPDGKPCEFDTRGLLQRAHIVANWPPIYIGKESDKHWEEGEDLSLLEFKAIEYKRKGNAVANDEQLARIAKVPKREFMRRGINQHTLEKICRKEAVRASRMAEVFKVLQLVGIGAVISLDTHSYSHHCCGLPAVLQKSFGFAILIGRTSRRLICLVSHGTVPAA